jgi:hypothetical protein
MAAEPRLPGEYAADTGAAEPAVTAALAAYEAGTGDPDDVVAALSTGRLLVPVVAVLDEAGESGGVRTEKASHMATVTTTGRDGRRGLLAFTCLDSMRRWNPTARPVPVPTRLAASAALADGVDAVVVDLAGPVVFAIEGGDLQRLGSGVRDGILRD